MAYADVINGSFETGDLSGWVLTPAESLNGVDDKSFPHHGRYQIFFGESYGLASLSQWVPTIPGMSYQVTFWMTAEPYSHYEGAIDEFKIFFGGQLLSDLYNIESTFYTQYSYSVTASSFISLLQFEARNDSAFFLLDDIHVIPKKITQ